MNIFEGQEVDEMEPSDADAEGPKIPSSCRRLIDPHSHAEVQAAETRGR